MADRRLEVVQRDEGEPLSIGAKTGVAGPAASLRGAYCIFDQLLAPKQISPVHAHDTEDQVAWILSGSMVVWVDGEQAEVREGGFALRPAGLPHAMWNPTDTPVRFLEITSPAERFEAYMRQLSALIDSGASSAETVAELAGRNGIAFYPELTEQLVAGTGLTTAGGFWKQEDAA
jgi:mannose-6-phosphate isomerase-like protein (cupin superfamily)